VPFDSKKHAEAIAQMYLPAVHGSYPTNRVR
jgi:hypothetical protein